MRPQDRTAVSHDAVAAHRSQLAAGLIIDNRYKVLSLIGYGGHGSVYKVRHMAMRKICALKTIDGVAPQSLSFRLRKESEATATLDHPNIVRSFDFGVTDSGQPFMVMDFVEGPSLSDYLKSHRRISLATALHIFIPICYAMAYAHDQGVIHRDLKPGNIILTAAEDNPDKFIPKVVDFGLAKFQHDDGLHLTITGEIFGTPLYMSPEQCAGSGVDGRSDIYALGCVLFEALTGDPPFRGNTALETMMQHASTVAPSLREASLGEEFPEALERVVAKMLAKDSRNRHDDFHSVGHDLMMLQKGNEDAIRIVAISSPLSDPSKSAVLGAAGVLALIIAGIMAGAIGLFGVQKVVLKNSDKNEAPVKTVALLGSFPASTYRDGNYSQSQNNGFIKYQFPADKEIGCLVWWDKMGRHVIDKPGGIVPADAKVIFRAANAVLVDDDQKAMANFADDDLGGVILGDEQFRPPMPFNVAVAIASQQCKLRLLELTNLELNERAWNTIGGIDHLTWLRLHSVVVLSPKYPRGNTSSSNLVATLPNLQNLRVLELDDYAGWEQIMAQLAKSSEVRRLSIRVHPSNCTLEQIQQVSKLKNLDTLVLKGCNPTPQMYEALATMPKLKRLCVEYALGAYDRPEVLRKFKHLEKFVVGTGPSPDFLKQVSEQLPQYLNGKNVLVPMPQPSADSQITYEEMTRKNVKPGTGLADSWFDPLRTDPDADELW